MQKYVFLFGLIILISASTVMAQYPPSGGRPGGKGGFDPSKFMIGRLYGKVVDEEGKPMAYANVQLMGKKFDRATRTLKDTLWAGQFTKKNGEFNMEKLPIMGEFDLIISYLGYTKMSQKVDFGMKRPGGGQGKPGGSARPSGRPGGGFGGGFNPANFEKDLGKIVLVQEGVTMDEVSIEASATGTVLALDRKIYRVDKDLTTVGGTAEDALRNVPSISVDLDGNVSLRNGSPQIFVDGRPTTLTLDQIAADEIETIEVITNPSAKYDAGGGTGGILNIVLKKERRLGYNGSIRFGGDTRLGYNVGGNFNIREGKINVFGSGGLNSFRSIGDALTERDNLVAPISSLVQTSNDTTRGTFVRLRGGFDFLMDNRNTLTVSGSFVQGSFLPVSQLINTTETDSSSVTYTRDANQDRMFRNAGVSVQFKHLFTKKGAELTADANYNQVTFEGDNQFLTTFDDGATTREQQFTSGGGSFLTLQTDFVNPLSENLKLEGGLKTIIQTNRNEQENAILDPDRNEFIFFSQVADRFEYTNNIFAAYLQTGYQKNGWGVQAGLRAESSFYTGTLTEIDSSFQINFPISLFPSVFFSRKFKEGKDEIQLAYTRRINRPNFFQTLPYTDYSDSLNLRRGNVGLLPEFGNNIELTYQKFLGKNHSALLSVYYKQASNLITTYQFNEFDPVLNREVIVTSYINADNAYAFGSELTMRNKFFGWLELTTNINVYQAQVDATNVENALQVDQLSAFIKENIQIRLPKDYSLQINGTYRSRAAFTPANPNNRSWRGGPTQTAQGFRIPLWFLDVSVRKSFWNRKANITVSASDIFATRRSGTVTDTDLFFQEFSRIRNPQLIRVNFSYRFGKTDMSLFRRKNMNYNTSGSDMMGG
ncbi:MAG: outer membrane beta-barrel protein [Bacteroidota bacterium]